jgi:hypothetical protein
MIILGKEINDTDIYQRANDRFLYCHKIYSLCNKVLFTKITVGCHAYDPYRDTELENGFYIVAHPFVKDKSIKIFAGHNFNFISIRSHTGLLGDIYFDWENSLKRYSVSFTCIEKVRKFIDNKLYEKMGLGKDDKNHYIHKKQSIVL